MSMPTAGSRTIWATKSAMPARPWQLLDQWEAELDACYAGTPRHPVFVALAETVSKFEIPKHEFSDLLTAFRQDQTVTRFETFNDVLGYCRYSANPVGHLVLYLCGYQRCRAPGAFRLHLHRIAIGELLAGRERRTMPRAESIFRWKTCGDSRVS